MLDGIQNILGRIQEIEQSFQAHAQAPDVGFNQQLQQAQSAMAGTSFTPNPMASAMPGMTGMPMVGGLPGMQPFNTMNPSLWNMMNPNGLTCMPTATNSVVYNLPGTMLERAAASQDGRQYWSNACAHAVNDVLKTVGIDIASQTHNNPNWVPNYAQLGQKVTTMNDMRPGDLVIYNNYLGEGGYDHIGIYAGNGEAWNVSTMAGHKWVKTAIGSRFQEGRRITTPN